MHLNENLVIAITGDPRVGKTTVANFMVLLLQEQGYSVNSFAFADKLKAELGYILQLEDIDGYKHFSVFNNRFVKAFLSAFNFSFIDREVIGRYAANLRSVRDDYYAKDVVEAINDPRYDITIVSDLRHEVELEYLKKFNVRFVHITKSGYSRPKFDIDYETIHNKGSLTDLKHEVGKLLKRLDSRKETK